MKSLTIFFLTESKFSDHCYLQWKTIFCKLYCKNGPRRKKTCLRGFANNTGADQPAHPRSLFSAFVIRFLKSTLSFLQAKFQFSS